MAATLGGRRLPRRRLLAPDAVDGLGPVAHAAHGVEHQLLRAGVHPAAHEAAHRLGARDELLAGLGVGEVAGVVARDGAVGHQHGLLRQRRQLAEGAREGALFQVIVIVVKVVSPDDGRGSGADGRGRGPLGRRAGRARAARRWAGGRGARGGGAEGRARADWPGSGGSGAQKSGRGGCGRGGLGRPGRGRGAWPRPRAEERLDGRPHRSLRRGGGVGHEVLLRREGLLLDEDLLLDDGGLEGGRRRRRRRGGGGGGARPRADEGAGRGEAGRGGGSGPDPCGAGRRAFGLEKPEHGISDAQVTRSFLKQLSFSQKAMKLLLKANAWSKKLNFLGHTFLNITHILTTHNTLMTMFKL